MLTNEHLERKKKSLDKPTRKISRVELISRGEH
jgi:hypothetical protein